MNTQQQPMNPAPAKPVTRTWVFIGGPPGSGKDTFAQMLLENLSHRFNTMYEKFALPLVALSHNLGFDMAEDAKDTVDGENGVSRRTLQIQASETLLKPLLGPEVFGRALARRVEQKQAAEVIIVSDSGFYQEYVAIEERFAGRDPFIFVQMERDGCTYEGDPRSNWMEEENFRTRIVDNNGSRVALFHKARILAGRITMVHGTWEEDTLADMEPEGAS